jgi:hypothetical protein
VSTSSKPGDSTYATGGFGGSSHLASENTIGRTNKKFASSGESVGDLVPSRFNLGLLFVFVV